MTQQPRPKRVKTIILKFQFYSPTVVAFLWNQHGSDDLWLELSSRRRYRQSGRVLPPIRLGITGQLRRLRECSIKPSHQQLLQREWFLLEPHAGNLHGGVYPSSQRQKISFYSLYLWVILPKSNSPIAKKRLFPSDFSLFLSVIEKLSGLMIRFKHKAARGKHR